MISDRHPRHVKLSNPPDRRRDIVAVTHSTASQGTLKPPPRTQRRPAVTPLGSQSALCEAEKRRPDVPRLHRQRGRRC
jgi:hypothetical protein